MYQLASRNTRDAFASLPTSLGFTSRGAVADEDMRRAKREMVALFARSSIDDMLAAEVSQVEAERGLGASGSQDRDQMWLGAIDLILGLLSSFASS